MSSDAVVKCVAKKLKYYFDVKRLEDGFDLSGVHSPQLDHPPLKSRPTLQYDGLHDRALKHYFSLPKVRVKLTHMESAGDTENREANVKRKVKRQMKRHQFLLTRSDDVTVPLYPGLSKSAGATRHRYALDGVKSPSPIPEYAYQEGREGRRLRRQMTGFGVLMKSNKHKGIKGGWPLLRSVPNQNMSKPEATRLVNMASKLLVATETVDHLQTSEKRPQSAPKPFESLKFMTSAFDDDEPDEYKSKQRVSSAKYVWDIHGRRHRNVKTRGYDDGQDRYESPQEYRRSRPENDRTDTSIRTLMTESPAPPASPEPEETTKPEPPKVRPRSAKRRHRQKTVIEVRDRPVRDEVTVHTETQTYNTGEQTEKPVDNYDREVTDGEWAEYQIYVRTGNRIGASTKATVKITIYGEKGRTKEVALENSKRHKVCFQKGKEDLFIIPAHYVGNLHKIKIGHDRTDLSNAWYLEGVTIYDMCGKRIYDFVCERWLSGGDGDRRTYRELAVDRDRAFIQALEEESDTETTNTKEKQSESTEYENQRDDKLSMKPQGSVKEKTRSSRSGSKRQSRRHSDSESDSDSSASSYSSSQSYTDTLSTERRPIRELSPVRHEQDDFFDEKRMGPTYTFKSIKDGENESLDSNRRREVSVESSSQDGQEFLQGYKTGLQAVEDEKRRKKEEENEKLKKILRGPTIHEASERGDLARIQELIHHFPEMKEQTDEQGLTALHTASKYGRIDVVKWLTVNDVSLNTETRTGYTAIHLAAMSGHVNCLMVLNAMGAVITCRTADKKTPLHLAAMNGHLECVKWLVANRSRLDVKDESGRTPREISEEFRHEEVAKFLRACEEEMDDPKSGFAQMRSTNKYGQGHLATIKEDTSSNSDEKPVWYDDNEDKSDRKREVNVLKLDDDEDREEKRKMYDTHHKKMEQTGDTFLDSIRHELDGGPEP